MTLRMPENALLVLAPFALVGSVSDEITGINQSINQTYLYQATKAHSS